MIIYIVAVLPSIVLITLGICVKYYKTYWLISGYNTMSAEKKKNVDVKNLARMMGNFCFVLAGFIFAFIFSLISGRITFALIVAAMLVAALIHFVIKSQKYDGNAMNSNGTMKKSAKIKIGAIIAFFIIVFLGVGILLHQSSKPATFNITEQYLEINGLYGETIHFEDIIHLSLSNEMPKITSRTNGSAIGNSLKGYFKAEEIGKVKLFVNTGTPPFIFIKKDNRTIILNAEDQAKTEEHED